MNRPRAPLFATVNVTGQCNLACRYCFYQPRSPDVMAWQDFQRVILDLAGLPVFFTNISGGEPFTHPQIDRFIEFAHEHLEHVVVLTNGTILTAEHAAAIGRIVTTKGRFPIQVSIDAVDPSVNSLTRCDSGRILENLSRLRDLGANIVVAMVITRHNMHCLLDSISSLSVFTRFFHLMPFQEVKALRGADEDCAVSTEEMTRFWVQARAIREELGLEIDTPLDRLGEKGCANGAPCMAAFSHLVVDPNLRVRPCDRVLDVDLGNLRGTTISEIWGSQAAMGILGLNVPICQA